MSSANIIRILAIAVPAGALAWAGFHITTCDSRARAPGPAPAAQASEPPPTTTTDPAGVFRKAFWRRPAGDDQILHAERREWSDGDGVSRWQWFIALKPGPALMDYLITGNGFGLTASSAGEGQPFSAPREWFAGMGEKCQIFSNPTRTLTFFWDRQANLLHATGKGQGFRPGMREPNTSAQNTAAPVGGRLPATPPPAIK